MIPEEPQPASNSAGPLLVLLAGAVFTGVMSYFLIEDLRFLFTGVTVQATARPVSGGTRLSFVDAEGRNHDVPIDRRPDADDSVRIRYLPGDPERVRLEEDIHPAWLWGSHWVMLGLAVTGFGVLLMWGRRPSRTRAWGRGRPSEW